MTRRRALSHRTVLMAASLLAVALLAGGCGLELSSARSIVLEITGTPGTPVTGEYIVTVGASTSRHRVNREVPFTVEIEGDKLSGFMQKQGGAGTVRARLLVNGNAVAFDWTKENFGNVRVATP